MLTGTYADGLGGVKTDAKRVDFDPFPWQSFAVWMLTQMKRWGQIKGDVDYKAVAEQVYLATDTTKVMKEMGLTPPATSYKSLLGDGQDVRSGKAGRLSRELQDQEGVVRAGAAFPLSSRRTPGPIPRRCVSRSRRLPERARRMGPGVRRDDVLRDAR